MDEWKKYIEYAVIAIFNLEILVTKEFSFVSLMNME